MSRRRRPRDFKINTCSQRTCVGGADTGCLLALIITLCVECHNSTLSDQIYLSCKRWKRGIKWPLINLQTKPPKNHKTGRVQTAELYRRHVSFYSPNHLASSWRHAPVGQQLKSRLHYNYAADVSMQISSHLKAFNVKLKQTRWEERSCVTFRKTS